MDLKIWPFSSHQMSGDNTSPSFLSLMDFAEASERFPRCILVHWSPSSVPYVVLSESPSHVTLSAEYSSSDTMRQQPGGGLKFSACTKTPRWTLPSRRLISTTGRRASNVGLDLNAASCSRFRISIGIRSSSGSRTCIFCDARVSKVTRGAKYCSGGGSRAPFLPLLVRRNPTKLERVVKCSCRSVTLHSAQSDTAFS